ncbi:MAG: rhomboid family intramembrane serine protease [Cytophagales bacterium]|nr:rhomboid family intramembrane serine protease [Cytophagales bacterium]
MVVPYGDINPKSKIPYINYSFIGINIIIFLMVNFQTENEILNIWTEYAYIPEKSTFTALFTSMFLHANIFHLLGNMLFLWITGDNIEDTLGHGFYIIFYIVAGVAATIVYSLTLSVGAGSIPTLGASGAISGVLGAYLVFFPKSRIKFFYWFYFLFGRFTLPALYAIGFWFVFQQLFPTMLGATETSGIAYWAHIGGFLFGVVIALFLKLTGLIKIHNANFLYKAGDKLTNNYYFLLSKSSLNLNIYKKPSLKPVTIHSVKVNKSGDELGTIIKRHTFQVVEEGSVSRLEPWYKINNIPGLDKKEKGYVKQSEVLKKATKRC